MKKEPGFFSIWRHDWYPMFLLRRNISAILRKISNDKDKISAIDLGCGSSPYSDVFLDCGILCKTADICGNPDYLIDESGKIAVESSTCDLVTSFQVLEHVWDIDAYFSEVKRLLRDDGVCVLSTHGVWLYHPHPGDYRRWTKVGLVREFESRGFVVLDVISILGPLGWLSVLRLIAYNHVLQNIPVVGGFLGRCLAVLINGFAVFEDMLTPRKIYNENASIYMVVAKKLL